jgi:hypothetical protein
MKKLMFVSILLAAIVMSGSTSLMADSLNLKVGLFYPQMDSELWQQNMQDLALQKQDMQAAYYAMEYEFFFDRNFSLAFEGGYYKKEHFSQYRDFEYDDGSPIFQNLSLEIASLEAGFKFYPLSHRARFCPFIGAGAGIYYWKYEQWGDFINFDDMTVTKDRYAKTNAYTPGFNAKGGFVFRFSRSFGISMEARYQFLKGSLSSFFEGFNKLDMNGFSYSIGLNFFL